MISPEFYLRIEMEDLPLVPWMYRLGFEYMNGEKFVPKLPEGIFSSQDSRENDRVDFVLEKNGRISPVSFRRNEKNLFSANSDIELPRDFYIVLQSYLRSAETRIPFYGGQICTEYMAWKMPTDPIFAQVIGGIATGGVLVRVGAAKGFLPTECLPIEFRSNPDQAKGLVFQCKVMRTDGQKPGVVPIGDFMTFDEWWTRDKS